MHNKIAAIHSSPSKIRHLTQLLEKRIFPNWECFSINDLEKFHLLLKASIVFGKNLEVHLNAIVQVKYRKPELVYSSHI